MKVYNTLTGNKEEFVPLKKGHVGMYTCGVTVYDSCHIGHARAAVAFDVVARYLRHKGYKVKFARNYTDIDDKIINRANKESRDWKELTKHYIKEYSDEMAALGNLKPDLEPKATDHIKDMIGTIKKLLDNGLAYQTESGVYFSIRNFKGYGKLSGKNIEDLESGARVSVDEKKRDPLDFALWKIAKPGEPSWKSPWGEGRPGWHIECSSMSSKYLGQPFDIHGGGKDLVFPHHENEIAQAEGAEGKEFAKYWLHNGFVNIDSEKMSKSLGNFLTIHNILEKYEAEAVRYFLLSNHYRSPLDYTEQTIFESQSAVTRFYETLCRLPKPKKIKSPSPSSETEKALVEIFNNMKSRIEAAMDDDFNTAGAFGVVFEVIRLTNKYLDETKSEEFCGWLSHQWHEIQKMLGNIFGMFGSQSEKYLKRCKERQMCSKGIDETKIATLISGRLAARKSKDFAKADSIKKQLTDMGVELRDKPDGTTDWKVR